MMKQPLIAFEHVSKLTNGELRALLVNDVVDRNRKAWEGHVDDALYFVKHEYKNRADLILGCQVLGIIGYDPNWGRADALKETAAAARHRMRLSKYPGNKYSTGKPRPGGRGDI